MDTLTGGAFIGAGLVQAAITVALYMWGSTVAARRETRIWWWARWMPILALILATVGVIGTVVQLVAAFDAASLAAPEQKAQELAESISGAMRWTLVTTVSSGVLYVASIVAFTIGTLNPVARPATGSRTAPPAPDRPPA